MKMTIKSNLLLSKINIFFLTVFFVSVLCSCNDENRVFESNQNIEEAGWTYDNSVVFEAEILDTTAQYNLYVNIRHTKNYEYSNLWMKILTTIPGEEPIETPVNLPIANADGKWFGSGLASVLSVKLIIQEKAILPKIGKYKFELIQNMRVDPVEDILDVGLIIEKSE